MSKRGRFGKYGEIKRMERLRKTRMFPLPGSGGANIRFDDSKRKAPQGARTVVRGALSSDLNYLLALGKESFEPYGPYEDILARWFQSGFAATLIALTGKRPEGFAMVGPFQEEPYFSHVFELLAIAVEPEKRRRGLGSLLLKEAEKKTRELQGEMLLLHTAVDNGAAQKLFTKHGFHMSRLKSKFYPRGQNAMLMVKRIS